MEATAFDQLKKNIDKLLAKRPMNKKKGIKFETEKLRNDYNYINRECLSFVLGSDVDRASLLIKNVFFDSMVIPALAKKIRYELFVDVTRIPHPKVVTDFIELPDLRYVIFFYSSLSIFTQLTIILGR